jgi:hypothetical protein
MAMDSSWIVRCDFEFYLDLDGRRTVKPKATAGPDETAPGSNQATWVDCSQDVRARKEN